MKEPRRLGMSVLLPLLLLMSSASLSVAQLQFICYVDGTCSGDILGQVPNSENCCRPVVAGGLGGSGFRIPGDEVCTSCNSMIVVCEDLPLLMNGRIEYLPDLTAPTRNEGTEATHICNPGFILIGNVIRTCQNDSFFDGLAPTCEPQCPELEPIENGSITYDTDMTPDFNIGTEATYECDPGFILVGVMNRNCTVGIDGAGVWTEDPPTCEPQCPELLPIVNGFITYAPDDVADFDIGTVATYECNPGYILVGVMTRDCVEAADGTGMFNGVAPVCEPKCPELQPIVNGFITYAPDDVADFDIGTVATYECNPGFILIGVMIRDCVEAADGTGVFDGVAPVCELVGDVITVELSSNTFSVVEGDRFVNVVILKSGITDVDLFVSVILSSLSAEGGVDFGPFPSKVVRLTAILPSNQTEVNYGVQINDDSIVESTEMFSVGLESADSHVTIGSTSTAIVSILDDDFVEFILQTEDVTVVEEGNTQVTFNLTKVGVADRDVHVVVRTDDGSASASGDYEHLSMSLTFASNVVVMEFSVTINEDGNVEATENFFLTFEPATGETGVRPNGNVTVITILDDNDLVTVSLSSTNSPDITEGSGGEIAIVATGNNEIPVSVSVEVSNSSTAIEGLDVFLNFSTTITLDPGVTFLPLHLVAISDGLYEGDDETITLIGQTADGETRVEIDADSAEVSVSIVDTDSVTIGFTSDVLTVGESMDTLNVTVLLINGEIAVDVTVSLDAMSDLAVMGEDFDFDPVDLTFGPGQSTSYIVNIDIMDDPVFEGREGFSLLLSTTNERVVLSPGVKEVLIVDNEDLVIFFSSTVYSVSETSSSVEVIVQLGEGIELQRNITLDLRSADGTLPTGATGGSDYQAVSTTLTFSPDATLATFSVMLLDDQISEGLEDFHLQVVLVDEALGDPGVLVEALVLIFDNEDIFVSLSSAEYVVNEGDGFVVVVIEKSGITPNNEETEVLLTLQDGTARGGSDYGPFPIVVPSSNFTAILPSNETNTLFGITVTDDNLVEGTESFSVSLNLIGSREGGIVFLGNVTMATVYIEDNDKVNVALVFLSPLGGGAIVREGNVQLNFSIVRNDSVILTRPVGILASTFSQTAGSDDYKGIEAMFELQPETPEHEETREITFPISVFDDDVAEGDEVFTVFLFSFDPNVVLSVGEVQVTIAIDDDVAAVQFVNTTYEAFEEERSVTVCLQKNAETAKSFVVAVQAFESIDVPEDAFRARANIDFDATSQNVTFDPNSSEVCLSIRIFQDGMPGESREVFSVQFNLPPDVPALVKGAQAIANVFVTDIPDVIVGFQSSAIIEVDEDVGIVEICLAVLNPSIDDPLDTSVILIIDALQGTADSTDFSFNEDNPLTLTLNNTHRSDCFSVNIIDDEVFEDPASKFFTIFISSVDLSNPELRVLLSRRNITVVITDDDRSLTIGFDNAVIERAEDIGSVELCVSITTPPPEQSLSFQSVVLIVNTQQGTAGEDDFTALTNEVVGTLVDDVRRTCFSVEITNDEIEEVDESFSVLLSVQVTGGEVETLNIDPSVAFVTIEDDDVMQNVTMPPPVLGNDTIVGDPLYTVPLNLVQGSELLPTLPSNRLLHLCYEIHGAPDEYFNLVSDTCTNVNALYTSLEPSTDVSIGFNVVSEIGVRAVNSRGECVNVMVDSASNCTPTVMDPQGVEVSGVRYSRAGIAVSKVRNRARISVPNCGINRLVMWVTCQDRMLRFDLTRGVQLRPTSHGLLGQFWNIPISVQRYFYNSSESTYLDIQQLYSVTVAPPNADSRTFVAEYGDQTWDTSRKDCIYAGNVQGGKLREILDDNFNDPVIEGTYLDYRVGGLYEHSFQYSQFNATMCLR